MLAAELRRDQNRTPRWLVLCVLTLLSLVSALAQSSRGTITGIVSDATKAVIPGAKVTILNQQTQVSRSTSTNEAGLYRFDAVDPGQYNITVETTGFRAASINGIPVQAGQTVSQDAALEVGEASTKVEVAADAVVLQTESPVRGGNVTTAQITQLPIASRDPVQLALTLPGVSTNRFGFGQSTFSVNGSRGRSNNFLIDGTENNDISVAGQAFVIQNPDAVTEVNVQTGNYDAEYGRAGGAVVNTITKSGTNSFHGTLGYLLESTRVNAITSSQSQSPDIVRRGYPPAGTEQWFNGTLGGPVWRNRTFFFSSYQEQRQASTSTQTLNTPSAAGRATLRSLFAPGQNRNVDLYLNATQGLDAASQLFSVDIGANRAPLQFGVVIQPYAQQYRDRQLLERIDHKFSDRDQLSGRYLFDDYLLPIGAVVPFFTAYGTGNAGRTQSVVVSETHVFSPNLTNEIRIPYLRIQTGFPNNANSPDAETLPNITIAGLRGALGVDSAIPQGRIANNYQLQDTVSWVVNRHTFRTGIDFNQQRARQIAPANLRGSLTYNASGTTSGFGNFIDDFGGSGGGATRAFGSAVYYPDFLRQAYFFQDRWRTSDALTLTLGVRYEYFGVPVNSVRTAAFTGLFNVNPSTLAGPYSQPSQVKPDKNNFAPTIGIAYSPTYNGGLRGRLFGEKKSVLRAGYQIGYDAFFNNIASNAQASSPNLISTLATSVVTTANPRGLGSLYSQIPTVARPLSPTDSQTLVDPNLRNPYYQRWSAGMQRELPGNFVLDVSYVGTKGTRLFINEDLNPLVPAQYQIFPAGGLPAGFTSTGRVDVLQGSRVIRTNGGSSIYHSGQTLVQRRFANGFLFTGAYTYAKLLDNGSEIFAPGGFSSPQQAAVPSIFGGQRLERAPSLFDRTHRATFTYLYELPFYRSQRALVGRVAGGWAVSGVTTFESGVPFTVTNGQDADAIGGNLDRPDFNPAGQAGVRAVPNTTSSTGYVNPDVLGSDGRPVPIDPAQARYIVLPTGSGRTGNLGRNTQRSGGIGNFNMNLFKSTNITERVRFEFRTEFYNLFNHPQYGVASASAFAPSVGTLFANATTAPAGQFLNIGTQDGGGRVIRFYAKIVF